MTSIETRGRNVLAELDRYLPETKNRSVEEVVQIFEQEAESGRGASGPLTRGAATGLR